MKVKYSDLNLLNICLANILATSNSLSGKVIHTFSKNTRLIKPFLEEADNSRKKIVDQYVDKDKDGKQKYKKLTDEEQEAKMQPSFSFTKENEIIANDEIQAIYKEEVEIQFIKLPLSSFETLSLDTSKIPGLDVFVEYMVDEEN